MMIWFETDGIKYFYCIELVKTIVKSHICAKHTHTHTLTYVKNPYTYIVYKINTTFKHLDENTRSIDKIIVQCLHAGGRLENF